MVTYGITQIKASAGSGKTYTLSRLFLYYLHTIDICNTERANIRYSLKNIIAMTFTNKAVSEMKESIMQALKKTAFNEEKTSLSTIEGRYWVDAIVSNYSSFRIQSIDSTLLQLIRSIAIELGLPSNCKPLLDSELNTVLEELYIRYIQEASHNPESIDNIKKACKALVNEARGSFVLHTTLKQKTLELVTTLISRSMFLEDMSESLESILSLYNDSIERLNRHYGLSEQKKEFSKSIEAIKKGIEEYEITDINARFIKALQDCSYDSKPSAFFTKTSFIEVLNKAGQNKISEKTLSSMEYIYARLRRCVALQNTVVYSVRIATEIAPMVRIAYSIITLLREYQKQKGYIAFNSVPLLLIQYFSDSNTMYQALVRFGSTTDTIFFDEFQDTSTAQWNALYPIIESVLDNNGSFIYVGDTKQAIYSWRGGDSSLFESILKTSPYNKTKQTLEYNWRSAEPIVSLANIFSEMEEEEYAQSFLTALFSENTKKILQNMPSLYQKGIQKLMEDYTKGKQSVSLKTKELTGRIRIVELLPKEKEEREPSSENEEEQSEDDPIQQEVYSILMETLSYSSYEDIAILTRTNTEASTISTWLLEWNIPHTIEGGIVLYSIPIIQNILSMLRFIHTQSEHDFFSVLVSSLCREYIISEKEILEWRAQHNNTNIIHQFMKDYPKLWYAYFAPFLIHHQTYTPYQYIQECVRCFKVYERFKGLRIYIDSLLEFVSTTEAEKTTSIPALLSYYESHNKDITVGGRSKTKAIQILSIHKSKGLEFPIVIIPFTTTKRRTNDIPLEIYTIGEIIDNEQNDSLADILDIPIITEVKSPHTQYYKKYIDKAVENINVLYVAFTRAKQELHCIIDSRKTIPESSLSLLIQHIITDSSLIPKHNIKCITTLADKKIYEYSTMNMKANNNDSFNKEEMSPEVWNTNTQAEPSSKIFDFPPFDIETTQYSIELDTRIARERKGEDSEFIFLEQFPIIKTDPYSIEERIQSIERGIILHKALEYCSMGLTIEKAVKKASASHSSKGDFPYYEDIVKQLEWFMKQPSARTYIKGFSEQRICNKEGKEIRADAIVENESHWIVIEYKTGLAQEEHKSQVLEYIETLQEIRRKEAYAVIVYFDAQPIIPQSEEKIRYYIYDEKK